MIRLCSNAFALLFLASCFSCAPPCFGQSPDSDLILLNGHILTVDSRDSIAQSIVIHDGKITAVGTNDEMRKFAPKSAKAIDLHGLTVTPGLIDTHFHFEWPEMCTGKWLLAAYTINCRYRRPMSKLQ